ncbi:MAG: hypothetical protein H8E18_00355, partial [FCB group bacterium]|nr:hypothetical protein [FCB group bacterium]
MVSVQISRDRVVAKALELENVGNWTDCIAMIKGRIPNISGEAKVDALLQLGKMFKYKAAFTQAEKYLADAIAEAQIRSLDSLATDAQLQLAICWQIIGKFDKAEQAFIGLLHTNIPDAGYRDYVKSHAL